MTDERFRDDALTTTIDQLVDVIRKRAYHRMAFPVNTTARIEDELIKYFKITEQNNVQYEFKLVAAKFSAFATEKVEDAIPLLQATLPLTRHELKQARRDVLSLDRRIELMGEEIMDKEAAVAWGADADTGVGSFATTGNHTDWTDPLDLGTFVEACEHWGSAVAEYQALLKDNYGNGELYFGCTTDVYARMISIFNTTQEGQDWYSWLADWLGRHNGVQPGSQFIIVTPYLGSAAGAGTTNCVIFKKDMKNLQLVTSPLELDEFDIERGGKIFEATMRSLPLFLQGVNTSLYEDTVVLTA